MTRVSFTLSNLIAILLCTQLLLPIANSSVLLPAAKEPSLLIYTAGKPVYFIVVEKKAQRLLLFEQSTSLKLLQEFNCATGENSGDKMISGDEKTPEGTYYITKFFTDSKITVFGSRAFNLDYPNIFDQKAGHLGDGIYIHGTNKPLISFSTNGCISLNNNDLDILAPYLTINDIPVIIVDKIEEPILQQDITVQKGDERFKAILQELAYNAFDSGYDNIETLYFIRQNDKAVSGVSYNTFDGERIKYSNHKRAYLQLGLSKKWLTVYAEQKQQKSPSILALYPQKTTLVDQEDMAIYTPPQNSDKELVEFIERWRSAWVKKDIDSYIDCYSPTFSSGNLDLNGWRNKKRYLNKKYSYIRVSIRDINIKWTDNGANVSFYQTYTSDKYRTAGIKTMQLVRDEKQWRILKEFM